MASFKRSIGLLAAAAFSMAAGSADAAGFQTIITQAPTGPGTPVKVKLHYDGAPEQQFSAFSFQVSFDSTQVELVGADDFDSNSANNANVSQTASNITTGGGMIPGYNAYKVVDGIDDVNPYTAVNGDLVEIEFLTKSGYSGPMKLDIRPYDAPDGFMDENQAEIVITDVTEPPLVYDSPVVTSVTPDGSWVANDDLVVTVNGSGFYDGSNGQPLSQIVIDGLVYSSTYVSFNQLTLDVDDNLVTLGNKAVSVANSGSQVNQSATSEIVEIVNRDIVYVDDTYAGNYSEGQFIASGTPNQYFGANAFATIAGGVDKVNATKLVNVADGTYPENVIIAKALNLVGNGPNTNLTNDDAETTQVLLTVNANDVHISDLTFQVTPQVGSAIYAYAKTNLSVIDCFFHRSGAAGFGGKLPSSLIGSLGSNWGSRGITFGGTGVNTSHVVLTGNDFTSAGGAAFMYAMQVYLSEATIGGSSILANTTIAGGAYRDLEFTQGKGQIKYNKFGTNVDVSNAYGLVELEENDFGAGGDGAPLHNEAALTIRGAQNVNADVQVNTNHFKHTGRGIWVGASKNVTIDGNDFMPMYGFTIDLGDLDFANEPALALSATEYTHILIDSRPVTSNEPGADVEVDVTNNTFKDVWTVGTAINLKNTRGNNFDLTFTGNTFEAPGGEDQFFKIDNNFNQDIDISNNNFSGVANSANVTLPESFLLENRITHGMDSNRAAGTGIAYWTPNQVFVTDPADLSVLPTGVTSSTDSSIQRAVDVSNVAGTINVQAGLYPESNGVDQGLVINKQVTVLGPNSANAGASLSRAAEAKIVPGVLLNNGTDVASDNAVITVTVAGVVLKGFTISGDNTNISGFNHAGMNVDAATGIRVATDLVDPAADNVVIQNNVVTNLTYIGVFFDAHNNPLGVQYHGLRVQNNLVENVQDLSIGYGFGLYLQAASGIVSGNTIRNVRNGMQIQPYKVSTVVAGENEAIDNIVSGWRTGIYYNYADAESSPWIVGSLGHPNTITVASLPSGGPSVVWDGIYVQTIRAGAGGTLSSNIIDGTNAPTSNGIRVNNVATLSNNLLFQANIIRNVDTGLSHEAPGNITFNGNNEISNTSIAAVDIDGAPAVVSGNNIHDNAIGIQTRGAGTLTANNNTLTANAKQFAFSTLSTVNGLAISGRLATDLETIANANIVNGKTYITETMSGTGQLLAESGFVNLRNTINGSITAAPVTPPATVKAMAGIYNERVFADKTIRLRGNGSSGAFRTTISPDAIGTGDVSAVLLKANNCILEGFDITRVAPATGASTSWGSTALLNGVQIKQLMTGCTVQDNQITNFFHGLYLNDCQANNAYRNLISNNRAGITICNNVTGSDIRENIVTGNWTSGIAFSEPTPTTVKLTTNLTIRNNSISGNWYSEVESDWVAAKTDVVDLSGNWFGTAAVTAVDTETPHATYGSVPAQPGSQTATISGISGKRLIDYNAWLNVGTDTSADMGFQGDFSTLNIAAASPLADKSAGVPQLSHVNDAVLLIADSGTVTGVNRTIIATAGTYVDGLAVVNTPVTITGQTDRALVKFNPQSNLQDGFSIESDNVTIKNLTVSGIDLATRYGKAIARNTTALRSNTKLDNLVIAYAAGRGVELTQPAASANSTGNLVTGCDFSYCDYAGLLLLSGVTEVSGCNFNHMGYQGVFAKPAVGSTVLPLVNVHNNTFNNTAAGVRIVVGAPGCIIGGNSNSLKNEFNLGNADVSKSTLGVSVESTEGAIVSNNQFLAANTYTAGYGGNIGVFGWDNANGLEISNNLFSSQSGPNSKAIYLTGFREGDLSNTSVGARNYGKTKATLSNNYIQQFGTAILLENADDATKAVEVDFQGTANWFDGSYTTGINFDGPFAAATGNVVSGVVFDNAPVSGGKYIVNTSANEIDIKTNKFAGFTPDSAPTATPAELLPFFNLANLLTDKLDGSAYGYLNLNDGEVFVPDAKPEADASAGAIPGAISRGALAADAGEQVIVQAGNYGNTSINKAVTVIGADSTNKPVIAGSGAQAVNMVLPASGSMLLDGFKVTGSAAYGALVTSAAPASANASFGIENCLFADLSDTSFAIGMGGVNLVSGAGSIKDCVIQDSGNGIGIQTSKDITIDNATVLNNFGTGIGAVTNVEGLTVTNSKIINSGMTITQVGDTITSRVDNANAYGVFLSGGAGNTVKDSTIAFSAATGFWCKDQSVLSGITTITGNHIDYNGISGLDGTINPATNRNVDGLKIKSSSNVKVTNNYFENNVRAAVLVDAATTDAVTVGSGIEISKNHITGSVPQQVDGIKAGLLLQMYNSPSSGIDAKGNWWNHVYGPQHADNVNYATYAAGGRGELYIPQSGTADVSTWYGQRSYTNRWYAVNDQDGDGIWDADEDVNLDGVQDAGETKFLRTDALSKDTDEDGFGDGVEIALGSNPVNIASTPATVDSGNVDPLTALANSSADTDSDGYKDYYEIAVGTNPTLTGTQSHPNLGDVGKAVGEAGTGQVDATDLGFLRRALVATIPLTAANVNQDNMDISRDGVVSNIDAIVMRRKTADSANFKLPVANL